MNVKTYGIRNVLQSNKFDWTSQCFLVFFFITIHLWVGSYVLPLFHMTMHFWVIYPVTPFWQGHMLKYGACVYFVMQWRKQLPFAVHCEVTTHMATSCHGPTLGIHTMTTPHTKQLLMFITIPMLLSILQQMFFMKTHYIERIMYELEWQIVYELTRGLYWYSFSELQSNNGNKHQNNPWVTA